MLFARTYAASEIEQMRKAASRLARCRDADVSAGGVTFSPIKHNEIESELRTYMIAGVAPEELDAEAKRVESSLWELSDEMEEEERKEDLAPLDLTPTTFQNITRVVLPGGD